MGDMEYFDMVGNKCTLWQMVRKEPDWAANRIKAGEAAEKEVESLRAQLAATEKKRDDLAAQLKRFKEDECFVPAVECSDSCSKVRDLAARVGELEWHLKRVIGTHNAPNDCYATGPDTGDSFLDLVQCPSCSAEKALSLPTLGAYQRLRQEVYEECAKIADDIAKFDLTMWANGNPISEAIRLAKEKP